MPLNADGRQAGFDSILVRLEEPPSIRDMCPLPQFRFHTGSIRRYLGFVSARYTGIRFDSILVRLEVSMLKSRLTISTSFDSILVRLEVSLFAMPCTDCPMAGFDSILVRLEVFGYR